MSWRQLLKAEAQKFISDHEHDDVRVLALKKHSFDPSSYALILDQIKVRQKSRTKSPDLYETDGIIFPDGETYEQASSSACAAYKASLVEGKSFVDLTAGSGVDSYYLSKKFSRGELVERNADSAALLGHNMAVLGKAGKTSCDLRVYNGDALEYMKDADYIDVVLIDPQRRENKGGGERKGIFDFSACSPDVVSLLPILKKKAGKVMIKASPVLDIERAIILLNGAASAQVVAQVHVVQWQGECKEVLYIMDFGASVDAGDAEITAVKIGDNGSVLQNFSYSIAEEKSLSLNCSMPLKYIYEPSAAFQKAGGFKSMAVRFDAPKIHQHSHLYTSDNIIDDFPGKRYEVIQIAPVQAKAINIKKADLKLRNFPDNVNNLKKKLKISDGGGHRIFATTLCNNDKKLIICSKL